MCVKRVGNREHDLKKTENQNKKVSQKKRHHPSCCTSGTAAGGTAQTLNLRLLGRLTAPDAAQPCTAVSRAAELWAEIRRFMQEKRKTPPEKTDTTVEIIEDG